jgi:hypothetical protein
LLVVAVTLPVFAGAQSSTALVNAPDPETIPSTQASSRYESYVPPSRHARFRHFTFDLLGPYPMITSAASAGIHQATDNPAEWSEGFDGYSLRFGSSYGISVVETSSRYGMAELLKEDTFYYSCQCTGVWPRLKHAVLSSFTGRRGEDGHRVLSAPSILSPFAGTFTATYLWYPKRYEAQDAARMGMNGLLACIGGNISLEFLYGGPHSLLKGRINMLKGTPDQDQQ